MIRYVYMDESGTHDDSPAIAMGAYVFTKEQAMRFSRDWLKDLTRFGLRYGHMTDCATGNGDYAKLSMTCRTDSAKALIAHTRHRSLFGIAVAADYIRYRELFGQGRYDHDAYTFCLGLCVTGIQKWAKRTGYEGRFAFIFEAGHAAQTEADKMMNQLRGSPQGGSYLSHSFAEKRDAPPLQAADMLAWHYAHHLKRRAEGYPEKRLDFVALLRPRDELIEIGSDTVDQWRHKIDDLHNEILHKLPSQIADITPEEIAWASAQMKHKE